MNYINRGIITLMSTNDSAEYVFESDREMDEMEQLYYLLESGDIQIAAYESEDWG